MANDKLDYSAWIDACFKDQDKKAIDKLIHSLESTMQETRSLAICMSKISNEVAIAIQESRSMEALNGINKLQQLSEGIKLATSETCEVEEVICLNCMVKLIINDLNIKGLIFRPDFQSGDRYIKAKISQVHCVLSNLILNALEAMKNNTNQAELMVKIGSHPTEKNRVRVEIKNNGPHIPLKPNKEGVPSVLYIFESGYTTKTELGAGHGLTLVEKYVRLNGGKVGVSNLTNGGVVFSVSFPEVKKKDTSNTK